MPYFEEKFKRKNKNLNIFAIFIDKSVNIVNNKYIIGLLIPKNFIKTSSYQEYRESFINNINRVVDFGKFPYVAQECIGLFMDYNNKPNVERMIFSKDKIDFLSDLNKLDIMQDKFKVLTLSKLSGYDSIINKMQENIFLLNEYFTAFRGMEHGRNGDLIKCPYCNYFFERPGKMNKELKIINCKHCKKQIKINDNSYKFIHQKQIKNTTPLLIGNSIDRYICKETKYYIENNLFGIDYKELNTIEEKLFFIRISKYLRGYYDNEKLISLNALNIVIPKKSPYSLKYLLGILNSKLYTIYADIKITSGADLTIRFSNEIMNNLPIHKLDFSNKADKEIHDKLVNLVDNIMTINKKLNNEINPDTINILKRQVLAIDEEIDRAVYGLYGLSEDEISIVENAN